MKNIYETFKITVMSWYRKQNIIFKMLHFFHKFAHLCLFLYFPVPKLHHSSGCLTSSLCSLPVQASYRQVTLFFTHTMPSPPQCISASRKISQPLVLCSSQYCFSTVDIAASWYLHHFI